MSIFGIVLRDADLQARVLDAMIEFLPIEGSLVADSLREVADLGPTVTIVSLVGAAWAAGALSAAIRQALNQAFEVTSRRPMVRAKLVDFVLLPVIALPLLGGIFLSGTWRFFQQELDDRWGILDGRFAWTWEVGAFFIPLTLSFTAFLTLYWLAPNREQRLRYIWPGALFAALAFEGLKSAFGFYIETFGNYSIYGSLGSVIVLLFWVYLTANITIFGAEIANEVPHVLHRDPHVSDSGESDLKHSLWKFVRGLVLAQEDEVRPTHGHDAQLPGTDHTARSATEATPPPEDGPPKAGEPESQESSTSR